jgi:hypothetical protein
MSEPQNKTYFQELSEREDLTPGQKDFLDLILRYEVGVNNGDSDAKLQELINEIEELQNTSNELGDCSTCPFDDDCECNCLSSEDSWCVCTSDDGWQSRLEIYQ